MYSAFLDSINPLQQQEDNAPLCVACGKVILIKEDGLQCPLVLFRCEHRAHTRCLSGAVETIACPECSPRPTRVPLAMPERLYDLAVSNNLVSPIQITRAERIAHGRSDGLQIKRKQSVITQSIVEKFDPAGCVSMGIAVSDLLKAGVTLTELHDSLRFTELKHLVDCGFDVSDFFRWINKSNIVEWTHTYNVTPSRLEEICLDTQSWFLGLSAYRRLHGYDQLVQFVEKYTGR